MMRNPSIKSLKSKIWKLFSEWVRRSSDECYTCGAKGDWKEANAGHFVHGCLDYDPRNVHRQCVRCNRYLSGNLGVYAVKLANEIGLEQVEWLQRQRHVIWKPSREELEQLLSHWKEQVSKLNGEGAEGTF